MPDPAETCKFNFYAQLPQKVLDKFVSILYNRRAALPGFVQIAPKKFLTFPPLSAILPGWGGVQHKDCAIVKYLPLTLKKFLTNRRRTTTMARRRQRPGNFAQIWSAPAKKT